MGKKKWVIIVAAILVVAAIGVGVGLGIWTDNRHTIPYHAVIYNDAEQWMKEDFLKENITANAFLYYDEETSSIITADSSYTRNYTHLVTDKSRFEEIFNHFPQDVDFETEMLIIYISTSVNKRERFIKNLSVDDNVLNLSFYSKDTNDFDSVQPYQRCLVVKMDKISIQSVIVGNS